MNSKLFLMILMIPVAGRAQQPTPMPSPVQAATAYEYKPVNQEFWDDVQKALKDNNFTRVISLSQEQYEDTKRDSLENAEAQLAAGIGLSKLNFNFAATLIFGNIIKSKIGTAVAVRALDGMEEVVRKSPVDEDFVLGEVVNDLEFPTLPVHLGDFVGFQQGMFNLIRGYKKWSEDDFEKVTPNSFWDFKMQYLVALGEVARDRTDSAIERLAALSNNELAPDSLKDRARHNLARLIFEKGDYPRAYALFKDVNLNMREKGLILLERAWAKYYEKDYSKALGLLAALEAPLFDPSRTPEMYILKMVMYNELCYYDAAFQTFETFKSRYANTLRAIKKRKDLKKDQQIIHLSVVDQRIQKWVDLLNSIKDEKELLSEYSWSSNFFYRDVRQAYDFKIKELYEKLDRLLQNKTREVADRLLDFEDQLTFLDYQTRLDSLRVTSLRNTNDYRPEEIPLLTFDKIYWISTGEYWLDELEDLKVFVESKCGEGR